MTEYVCARCGFHSNRRLNYHNHLNTKRTCPVINQNISVEDLREQAGLPRIRTMLPCGYCHKEFCNTANLYQHHESCKEKRKQIIQTSTSGNGIQKDNDMNDLRDSLLKNKEGDNYLIDKLMAAMKEIEELKTENACLKLERKLLQKQNIINNYQVNQVHNNIIINNFGNENMEYITQEFVVKCFNKGTNGIMTMFHNIYFNNEHKENHNVRLRSTKSELVEVLDNEKWVPRDLSETIKSMVGKSRRKIIDDIRPNIQEKDLVDYETLMNMNSIQNHSKMDSYSFKRQARARLLERRETIPEDFPIDDQEPETETETSSII